MRFNNDVRHQAAKELAIRYINSKWRYDKKETSGPYLPRLEYRLLHISTFRKRIVRACVVCNPDKNYVQQMLHVET
jgi:hypothetical protein